MAANRKVDLIIVEGILVEEVPLEEKLLLRTD